MVDDLHPLLISHLFVKLANFLLHEKLGRIFNQLPRRLQFQNKLSPAFVTGHIFLLLVPLGSFSLSHTQTVGTIMLNHRVSAHGNSTTFKYIQVELKPKQTKLSEQGTVDCLPGPTTECLT